MGLRKFAEIVKLAEKHHGKGGLKQRLAEHRGGKTSGLQRGDDRFLAGMAKAVFSAGFSWQVIENRWPGFEDAFEHFDPHRVAFYADHDVARLLKDVRIVRNGAKIAATIANARFVIDTAKEHGAFGKFLNSSKADMKVVQAAFNAWAEESGLPQRDVSRILSFSIGPSA